MLHLGEEELDCDEMAEQRLQGLKSFASTERWNVSREERVAMFHTLAGVWEANLKKKYLFWSLYLIFLETKDPFVFNCSTVWLEFLEKQTACSVLNLFAALLLSLELDNTGRLHREAI